MNHLNQAYSAVRTKQANCDEETLLGTKSVFSPVLSECLCWNHSSFVRWKILKPGAGHGAIVYRLPRLHERPLNLVLAILIHRLPSTTAV